MNEEQQVNVQGANAMLDQIDPEELTAYIRGGDGDSDPQPQQTPAPAPAPQQPSGQPAPQQPAGAPAGAPAAPAAPSELDILKARLAELQANQGTTQPAPTPAPAGAAPAAPAAPAASPTQGNPLEPDLTIDPSRIPDALLQGLASQDPAHQRQAIAQLVQATISMSFQAAKQMAQAHVAQAIESVRSEWKATQQQQTQQAQLQQINNDYYSTYPALNSDIGRYFTVQASQEIYQQYKLEQWSPVLRDLIAAKTMEKMRAAGINVQAPAAPQAQPPAAGTPPSFTPASVGGTSGRPNGHDEFSDFFVGLGAPST